MSARHFARHLGGRLGAAAAALLLGIAPRTPAAPAGSVTVTVESCPDGFPAAVRRVLRVELGDLIAEGSKDQARDRLLVRCRQEVAEVVARSPDGGLARNLELRHFPPESRARAVALAGIELLAAQSPDVRRRLRARQSGGPKPGPGEAETGGTRPGAAAGARAGNWRVLLLGVGRRFVSGQKGLAPWGGGVLVERSLRGPLLVAFDADWGLGRRMVSAGEVMGSLGSGAASLLAAAEAGPLRFEAGGGARFGLAYLAGNPAAASSLVGRSVLRPWAGPLLGGRLLWLGRRLCAGVGLEVGHALVGAEGRRDAEVLVAVEGTWFSLHAGLGLNL